MGRHIPPSGQSPEALTPAIDRWLAEQFARPHGLAGRWLLGPLLDRIGMPMMDAAFDALSILPSDHVLDLGFGGGALTRRLLDAGARVAGVDRSEPMVVRANARWASAVQQGRVRFLVGDAHALPLGAGAFTAAASVNTLYFWPDPVPVLVELHRVLGPGGRLVLCFQTADAVRAWPGHVHGFHAHDIASVGKALSTAGFAIRRQMPGQGRHVGDFCCIEALRGGA